MITTGDYLPKRMTLPLMPEVARALLELAKLGNKNPRDVAAEIVKEGLEQRGLLRRDHQQPDSPQKGHK